MTTSTIERNEVIALWPDGPPDPLPDVGAEATYHQAIGGEPDVECVRNVTRTTLTVFRPEAGKANGTGVVICPGGGWRMLAWRHEGLDMARWFAARGVTAFVLKYRVTGTPEDPEDFARFNAKAHGREADLAKVSGKDAPRSLGAMVKNELFIRARKAAATDGRRALAVVRERAKAFGLDATRIGMIGFSAGAFLTVDVVMQPEGPPPAFAGAIYGGETCGAAVPADAPPLFACIAQDDRMLFRVVEGLYADWSDADRPAEFHVFQKGGHGFGMIAQGRPVDRWTMLLEAWLDDLGLI